LSTETPCLLDGVAHHTGVAHTLSPVATAIVISAAPYAAVSIGFHQTERRISATSGVITRVAGSAELIYALRETKDGALLIDYALLA